MIRCWRLVTNPILRFKSKGLVFYIILLLLFVASCKNSESDLGLNLRADKGEFYSAETDTFTVNVPSSGNSFTAHVTVSTTNAKAVPTDATVEAMFVAFVLA